MIDPPTPPDGTCARCGRNKAKVRGVPSKTDSNHPFKSKVKARSPTDSVYVQREAQLDPFCSAMCCRIYYGLQPAKPLKKRKGKCKGCSGDLDNFKPDCKTCRGRKHMRESNERKRRSKIASI